MSRYLLWVTGWSDDSRLVGEYPAEDAAREAFDAAVASADGWTAEAVLLEVGGAPDGSARKAAVYEAPPPVFSGE